MKKNPKVSVVIPIYNVEIFLSQCIESIIHQTLEEIEIILVDDGSTDNSGKIADEYAKKDIRIKVIHKANGGLSDARNAGIKAATGDYIGFVDSDDYVSENMFKKMYQKAKKEGTDVVVCNIFNIIDGKFKKVSYWPQQDEHIIKQDEIYANMYLYPCYAVNKIYKRDFIEKNNLLFIKGYLYEDVPFFTQVFLNVKKVSYCIDNFYFYRIGRSDAITAKKSLKHLDICEIVKITKNIIDKHNVPEIIYENFNKWQSQIYVWMYNLLPDDAKQRGMDVINQLPENIRQKVFLSLNTKKIKVYLFDKFYIFRFKTNNFEKTKKILSLFKYILTYKGV